MRFGSVVGPHLSFQPFPSVTDRTTHPILHSFVAYVSGDKLRECLNLIRCQDSNKANLVESLSLEEILENTAPKRTGENVVVVV